MTRWARGGNANKKKPNEASSWEELTEKFGESGRKVDSPRRTNKKSENLQQGKKRQGTAANLQHIQSKRKFTGTAQGSIKEKKTVKPEEDDFVKIRSVKDFAPPLVNTSKSIVDVVIEADLQKQTEGRDIDSKTSQGQGGGIDEAYGSLEHFQKREKRREERRLKRKKKKVDKMVCFHCRQPGHGVADCPETQEDVEQGTGICFRCGSTEHDISKCAAKVDRREEGEFPYAKCFICHQLGHLSRSCPDNPRGLYPEGGACKECGSVEHRWWNCPVRKPVKGVTVSVTAQTVMHKKTHMSADAEEAFMSRPKAKVKKIGPKVVVF
ncbi:uncharacterized protein [Diadema antillarum]|uniref:uncharacterized protein n=1 Tax=Diadema antillarum TaxID=105358 RepID=UPI003A88327E